ncbi:MAG: SDR family oxidoreductase [Gemmatimonadota bacterium]
MRRCIVIGASGFLGRHLLDLGDGWQTVGTALSHPSPGLIQLDLTRFDDLKRCLDGLQPDLVIYVAGLTSVDECEADPDLAELLNAIVPAEIAERPGCRLLYVSTDYVFDGRQGHYAEDSSASPINAYGASKARGEKHVLSVNESHLVLRVSGLFDSEGTREGLFPRRHERPDDYVDTNRISSPVHVEDVRRAVHLVVAGGVGGIWHAGGPDALSRYQFRQIIALHDLAIASARPKTYIAHEVHPRRPLNTSLASPRLQGLGWRAGRVLEWFPPHAIGRSLRRGV